MGTLQSFLPFVKRQASRVERLARQVPDHKPKRQQELHQIAQEFHELAKAIEALPVQAQTMPRANPFALIPQDLEDLPPELLDQLSISDSDRAEFAIVRYLEENGGLMNLDRILIAIYRDTGEIADRARTNSKLYRMCQKGLIKSVPGKKSAYALPDVDTSCFGGNGVEEHYDDERKEPAS